MLIKYFPIMDQKQITQGFILKGLEPLFQKAEENGLWFHSVFYKVWFSPSELKEQHANGLFIHSSEYWELRNPNDKLNVLKSKLNEAQKAFDNFNKRMNH